MLAKDPLDELQQLLRSERFDQIMQIFGKSPLHPNRELVRQNHDRDRIQAGNLGYEHLASFGDIAVCQDQFEINGMQKRHGLVNTASGSHRITGPLEDQGDGLPQVNILLNQDNHF